MIATFRDKRLKRLFQKDDPCGPGRPSGPHPRRSGHRPSHAFPRVERTRRHLVGNGDPAGEGPGWSNADHWLRLQTAYDLAQAACTSAILAFDATIRDRRREFSRNGMKPLCAERHRILTLSASAGGVDQDGVSLGGKRQS
jgi:hypothetical protein